MVDDSVVEVRFFHSTRSRLLGFYALSELKWTTAPAHSSPAYCESLDEDRNHRPIHRRIAPSSSTVNKPTNLIGIYNSSIERRRAFNETETIAGYISWIHYTATSNAIFENRV